MSSLKHCINHTASRVMFYDHKVDSLKSYTQNILWCPVPYTHDSQKSRCERRNWRRCTASTSYVHCPGFTHFVLLGRGRCSAHPQHDVFFQFCLSAFLPSLAFSSNLKVESQTNVLNLVQLNQPTLLSPSPAPLVREEDQGNVASTRLQGKIPSCSQSQLEIL